MELFRERAFGLEDLGSWKHSKNKIVNIGIPAYAFLECFLRSIKSGSSGFIMRKRNLLNPLSYLFVGFCWKNNSHRKIKETLTNMYA